jgi:hypothetical protein
MNAKSNAANSSILRGLVWIVGGTGVVAMSFFATLYALDYWAGRSRDQTRLENILQIRNAVERYHRERGAYPILDDKPVTELKAALVGGGIIASIPTDPLWAGTKKEYRYYSDGTNYFGLLAFLEQAHGPIPAGGPCLAGHGTKGTGLWGQPPDCPL